MNTKNKKTYGIKVAYGYYYGTLDAPVDGFLLDYPKYSQYEGKEVSEPLEFESVEAAITHLSENNEQYGGLNCSYDGNGEFSKDGTYCTSHGEHSRPVYTIVGRSSGRCTKAIVKECDALNA